MTASSKSGRSETNGEAPGGGVRYVIKVSLRHIRPPIWRRLELPADLTLGELHEVLQTAIVTSHIDVTGFSRQL